MKFLAAGESERTGKKLWKIAAAVSRADGRLVRHLARPDKVASPDFGAIHAKLGGCFVCKPLQHITGFGPAGAAIGIRGGRIGEYACAFDEDCRRAIDAGKKTRIDRARYRRAESRDIGAE